MEIRNIAIIAHVDHGKTTLTDAIMRQCGEFEAGMSMDTNALEKERGITIYAKNSAVFYRDTKINIVDTPGHTDFGSEVERVLRSIDSVLLVVDAQEGPMPQTRFVLKKSLELGLKPILVINKIDKPAADSKRVEEEVFGLFMELGANDEQLDFTTVYAIGRDGVAKRNLKDESLDLTPLLEVILEKVPVAAGDINNKLLIQPFNLAYDNFLGRMAIARIYEGRIKTGDKVCVIGARGNKFEGNVSKLFTFKGVARMEAEEAEAGDIVMMAGLADIYIGDTVGVDFDQEPLPAIKVDEPTISLTFMVNNSPFGGREGNLVTSRQIRERLEKELEVNVGLRVDFDSLGGDSFEVLGRGELHIAVLLENMRREGFEVQVSQPQVIIKEEEGKKVEPFEEVTIDAPASCQGIIIERLAQRKAQLISIVEHEGRVRLIFEGPTRGLLGYKNQFIIDTKGEGIYAGRVIGFRPHAGEIRKRVSGSMISMMTGKALGYALYNLQSRGILYIWPNTEVYEGMVIGSTAKGEEMSVNPIKGKQLTNMRAAGSDDNIVLAPPVEVSLERGLEIMADDEFLEITPKSIRLRKQFLNETERIKAKRNK